MQTECHTPTSDLDSVHKEICRNAFMKLMKQAHKTEYDYRRKLKKLENNIIHITGPRAQRKHSVSINASKKTALQASREFLRSLQNIPDM